MLLFYPIFYLVIYSVVLFFLLFLFFFFFFSYTKFLLYYYLFSNSISSPKFSPFSLVPYPSQTLQPFLTLVTPPPYKCHPPSPLDSRTIRQQTTLRNHTSSPGLAFAHPDRRVPIAGSCTIVIVWSSLNSSAPSSPRKPPEKPPAISARQLTEVR